MERLEGRVSVLAALDAGKRKFDSILVSNAAHKETLRELLDAAQRRGVSVKEVDEAELEAHGKSHGGVVALVEPKPLTGEEELYALVDSLKSPAFVALFEGADDVRNLGYLMRTAEAFGVHAVIVRRRAWDVDVTALSRSSSGSYERLPVVLMDRDLKPIAELKKRRLKLVGAIPRARDPIYTVNLAVPLIMAIGGEKRGLSGAVREECDRLTCIPTAGGPTSLAMTQAGAIVLAEVARQRRGA